MGNCLRQLVVLSSVAAKCRKFWLVAALVPLSLGLSEPAVAQNCAPVANGGNFAASPNNSTVCTGPGPFNTNINFGGPPSPPPSLSSLTLQQGLIVNSPGGNAVNIQNTFNATDGSGASATINANDATITNISNPGGNSQSALRLVVSGNATVTASGIINVTGTNSTNAIFSTVLTQVPGWVASVTYDGPLAGPGITATGGANSTLIQACANDGCQYVNTFADANANIVAAGNLTGIGPSGPVGFGIGGLFAVAGGFGNASVLYSRGTIDVSGFFANGIFASGEAATVTTLPGTNIIVTNTAGQQAKPGIAVDVGGGALTVNAASTIQMLGPADASQFFRNNGFGIRASSFAGGPISVTLTPAGSITTQGGNGIGIAAASGGGGINVTSSGLITTSGVSAMGILADAGTIINGPGGGPIIVNALGAISTQGAGAHGIWASSTTGTVQVNATNVSTTGQFSTAINATGGGDVTVNVGGPVMGGWQALPTGIGSSPFGLPGLPSAGVFLSSTGGTATLTNNGSIGALSDRAVAGDPQVINNGLITGFVQFTGGDNSIINNNTFDLRHFADTNGDGVRDTLRVAIADLGDGPNNSFTNNGILRLPAVTGAITLDSTGQYLPLGNPNNAMAIGGPLQGHLIGVTTFTNSGIIDLQSNPAAGDVLVITGARQAGVAGPGTYISNGGTLRLDTVLNQGDAATRSDTLVVDGTSVGAGATGIAIRNAGGTGLLTVGDGILVVEVKNPARSASGAFTLNGGFISAGAFDYFLFKGGASPGSQGNWYLRNTLVAPPTPGIPLPEQPQLPTPVPGAPPIPLFNPEVPLKSVVPSIARSLGLVTLGTFNERQGDQLLVRGDANTKIGAWGRVFGQGTREQFAQGARPDFDGTFAGFQAGADLLRWESSNGHSDRIGFYVAQARASGAVHGLVDAFEGAPAGHVDLDATSYGGYWTHLGPSNWYIDAVLQGTYFQTAANSIRGFANNFSGGGFAASIEGGYPIPLMSWLTFEPQIQGIWQRTSFDDTLGPAFSTITFDRSNVFTGRVGALLRGTFGSTGAVWQPYLKGNVWWGSNGFDTVTFNGFGIQTGRNGGTTLEGGGGVTGKLARNVSVYGDASYLSSVSGESRITLKGNVGLRVTW